MKIFKYIVGPMGTNSYILLDESTKKAALIDPGAEPERLLSALNQKGADLSCIILTHAHFDHILALNEIKDSTGAEILVHESDAPFLSDNSLNLLSRFSQSDTVFKNPDRLLHDGDIINIGESSLRVLHTPGHTPGSICLFTDDTVISGDTLFRESIGRYDFPLGDYNTIMSSLRKLIKETENKNYKILPGHGPSSTIQHELEYNVYLK